MAAANGHYKVLNKSKLFTEFPFYLAQKFENF
jgi:hypothetical protein